MDINGQKLYCSCGGSGWKDVTTTTTGKITRVVGTCTKCGTSHTHTIGK